MEAFSGTVSRPWGYFELMATLGKGRDTRIIDLQCLMVSYKSVYNCILGRLFTDTLDMMAYHVHLKLKYHNVHDELVTINAVQFGTKRIHKALQCDKVRYKKKRQWRSTWHPS